MCRYPLGSGGKRVCTRLSFFPAARSASISSWMKWRYAAGAAGASPGLVGVSMLPVRIAGGTPAPRASGPAVQERHLRRRGEVVLERERRLFVAFSALPARGDRRVQGLGQVGREEALLRVRDALDVEPRALAQARDVRLRRGRQRARVRLARALEVQLERRLPELEQVQEGVVR